jgi:hypothetical protein
MPLTQGRYVPVFVLTRRERFAFRLRGLRGTVAGFFLYPPWRRHPEDTDGGFQLRREWGFWMVRPNRGWRSVRWVTPPVHATRHIPRTDRDAAGLWGAHRLGLTVESGPYLPGAGGGGRSLTVMGRHVSSPVPAGRRAQKQRSGTPATGRQPETPEKAREVVRDWIVSAGLVPSEDSIAELLPVARVWAPQYRRVAIKLVAEGRTPTLEAVESVTRQTIAAKKQAAAQRDAEVAAFVAECGSDARAWVRRYCTTHGHGPLWSELATALELQRRMTDVTIRALEREGWIRTGPEARSMRPGPRSEPNA